MEEIEFEQEVNEEKLDPSLTTVEKYLEKIGETPLLTKEQEIELAKKMEEQREKLTELAIKAVGIIKDNQELLALFKREKIYKSLTNFKANLNKIIKIADFLEQKKGEISRIRFYENREEWEKILEEIEKTTFTYKRYKRKMMKANLRLVVSFAKKYTGKGISFPDLIQEGNIGLSRAVDKFDYKCERRFSTYASWWIRQSLRRAIIDQSQTIRLPVHVAYLLRKLSKVSRELEQELKREPTIEEIAKQANISPEKIRETMGITRNAVSFDTLVGENKDVPLIDFIPNSSIPPPVYKFTLDTLKEEVRELLGKVVKDKREMEILKLRFGLEEKGGYSLREIGKKYGVSRERIRQIQKRALNRLRIPAEKRGLRSYLQLLNALRAELQ